MDAKIEKILLKLRKNATSALNAKNLVEAFPEMGWKVEQGEVDGVFSRYGYGGLGDVAQNFLCSEVRGALRCSPFGGPAFWMTYARDLSGLREELVGRVGEIGPFGLILAEVGDIQESPRAEDNGRLGFEVTILRRGLGLRVTSPSGESMSFAKDGKHPPVQQVLRWAYERGLSDDASRVLMMPSVDEEKASKITGPRTLENTGTCPACFGIFKLSPAGRMVHHGYHRPGYGYLVGDCLGVALPPLENDRTGLEYVSDRYVTYAENAVEKVQALQKRPDKLTVVVGHTYLGAGCRIPKTEKIGPEDRRFERTYQEKKTEAEREAAHLKRVSEARRELAASWVEDDMPLVRREKRQPLKLQSLITKCY